MITYSHLLETGRLVVEALLAGGHLADLAPESLRLTIDGQAYLLYIRDDPNWSAGLNHRREKVLKVGRAYEDPSINALTLLHEIAHHLNGDVKRGGKPEGPDAQMRLLEVEIRAWQRATALYWAAHGPVPAAALIDAAKALESYFGDLKSEAIACAIMIAMGQPVLVAEEEEWRDDSPF